MLTPTPFDLYDPIPNGICVIDPEFRVHFWNRCMEDWTGINRPAIVGQLLPHFFSAWKKEHYRQRLNHLFQGGPPVLFSPQLHPQLFAVPTTEVKTLTVTVTHLTLENLGPLAVITVQDISDLDSRIQELRLAEAKLQDSVNEKIMLMRESHHRIKNNLTMISGLITLQESRLEDSQTKQILDDLQQRIMAIAQIHDLLHRSSSLTINSTFEYLDPLAKTLTQNLDEKGKISLHVEIDPTITLDMDRTVALGIIQTELLTNAMKYAFNRQERGTLAIRLSRDLDHLVYRLSQSGDTLPPSFEKKQSSGLGMLLLTSFVRQLKGESHWEKADPTVFTLRFPA